MKFIETKLKGAFIIEPEKIEDSRGFFARMWCKNEYEAHGLNYNFVQINNSFNKHRGIIRGLHYQTTPHEEVKLFRCMRGAMYDVIIDLRSDSPTYLEWAGFELTAENRKMLYVPENFAQGYQALVENTEVFYLVSQFYAPGAERGIRFDDPTFGIQWPEAKKIVASEKDKCWPDYLKGSV